MCKNPFVNKSIQEIKGNTKNKQVVPKDRKYRIKREQ